MLTFSKPADAAFFKSFRVAGHPDASNGKFYNPGFLSIHVAYRKQCGLLNISLMHLNVFCVYHAISHFDNGQIVCMHIGKKPKNLNEKGRRKMKEL